MNWNASNSFSLYLTGQVHDYFMGMILFRQFRPNGSHRNYYVGQSMIHTGNIGSVWKYHAGLSSRIIALEGDLPEDLKASGQVVFCDESRNIYKV